MTKDRIPLNTYDALPEELVKYFRINGMHFNRRMYEFAVSLMYTEDANGTREPVKPVTREQFEAVMQRHGVELPKGTLCDGMYVWSMACADFPESLPDDKARAEYVREYLTDPDQRDGFVFNRFYNDTVFNGIPIDWEYVNG
jgi:hypothetical protein